MTAFYGSALARVHDVGFRWMAEAGGRGVLEILRRGGVRNGTVVDLGCGSGIWARTLTDAGFDVLGVDSSAAMLRIARRTAPRAKFLRASFVDAKLPPCDAVTAMGEVLGYAHDPRAGTASTLRRVFRSVHRALRPGGLFVFDLAGPGREAGRRGRDGRAYALAAEGPGWACIHRSEEDARGRILTREITTFEESGGRWRRRAEIHRLRLHRPTAVAALLRDCGFRARIVHGYSALRFPRGLAGFVARKPPRPRRPSRAVSVPSLLDRAMSPGCLRAGRSVISRR